MAVLLFVILCLSNLSGMSLKRRKIREGLEENEDTLGAVEGSIFGLLSFLIGFTFNGAQDRFQERERMIVTEANSLGTLIQLSSLYPREIEQGMHLHLKSILEYRIAYYQTDTPNRQLAEAEKKLEKLYSEVATFAREEKYTEANRHMISALGKQMDIMTLREETRSQRLPKPIWTMLLLLSIISSYLMGYGLEIKSYYSKTGLIFSLAISLTVYLILNLDMPNTFMLNSSDTHELIESLRTKFK